MIRAIIGALAALALRANSGRRYKRARRTTSDPICLRKRIFSGTASASFVTNCCMVEPLHARNVLKKAEKSSGLFTLTVSRIPSTVVFTRNSKLALKLLSKKFGLMSRGSL
jgi:hypothetical protein